MTLIDNGEEMIWPPASAQLRDESLPASPATEPILPPIDSTLQTGAGSRSTAQFGDPSSSESTGGLGLTSCRTTKETERQPTSSINVQETLGRLGVVTDCCCHPHNAAGNGCPACPTHGQAVTHMLLADADRLRAMAVAGHYAAPSSSESRECGQKRAGTYLTYVCGLPAGHESYHNDGGYRWLGQPSSSLTNSPETER